MSRSETGRITQQRIAQLAGVSQSTVSLVLNGRSDGSVRIPQETRERILKVIEETGYVADPSARRLAGGDNHILGVFTYEPAFPTESIDFYTPLLAGIEAGAEIVGSDLLLFTSAPVVDGRRQLFHERNRLRLADGVLLLGVEMDPVELRRLTEDDFRVVAVGRRDTPGIPYVGIDYAAAATALVHRAAALGHERASFLHRSSLGESVLDRRRGVVEGAATAGIALENRTTDGVDPKADWAAVRASGATLLIAEEPALAAAILDLAERDGVSVPHDLSVVALGSVARPGAAAVEITRLVPPREELGERAVALLARILSEGAEVPAADRRTLMECPIADGVTLAAARATR
ncbi:LacI family transcriptional regulator [Microbacterium sp. cx-55]|uniref:LacI family DNA-binding transcriptional regulator n=1 Tax=Microbacterium sp. cx-55 TaxID=2875948 RepID=UPI001CBAABE4|nr:LacI family DNA-binding transcriptional regulator [Microbacterium sp. cx-55]MBZ4488413.1 LacI family transcriptional regulator [Microbacterium sp. cx-55]UGB35064.1 LacI family transcriptional regulator [Microbacterium sp. cx-55]